MLGLNLTVSHVFWPPAVPVCTCELTNSSRRTKGNKCKTTQLNEDPCEHSKPHKPNMMTVIMLEVGVTVNL